MDHCAICGAIIKPNTGYMIDADTSVHIVHCYEIWREQNPETVN